MLRPILLVLLISGVPAWAANAQEAAPVPPPPPIVEEAEEPVIEPDITIIRRGDEVIEEYRINGELYKVKVTPRRGKPYYLLYLNGPDAKPIRREIDDLQTPYWVIFSW